MVKPCKSVQMQMLFGASSFSRSIDRVCRANHGAGKNLRGLKQKVSATAFTLSLTRSQGVTKSTRLTSDLNCGVGGHDARVGPHTVLFGGGRLDLQQGAPYVLSWTQLKSKLIMSSFIKMSENYDSHSANLCRLLITS